MGLVIVFGRVQWCWTIQYICSPIIRVLQPHIIKAGKNFMREEKISAYATDMGFVVETLASSDPSRATGK